MRELFSAESIQKVWFIIAFAGVLAGGFLVLFSKRLTVIGLVIAAICLLNYGFWLVSDAIISRLGLDSVAGVLVQMLFAAIIGLCGGIFAAVKLKSNY